MKRIAVLLVAGGMLLGAAIVMFPSSGQAAQDSAVFVTTIPPGYRDWRLISVAREEGELDDIRAVLGNDTAIDAYRSKTLPFPEGTIIARLAWSYDASEENNKAFGRAQSFVAGHAKNGVQFMCPSRTATTSSLTTHLDPAAVPTSLSVARIDGTYRTPQSGGGTR